jgi:uncharacterized protein YyaL (SSP411 family)
MSETRKANRLIRETSPYLLQHAHNPVDWYPWGEEALDKARKDDRPLLVSIGYSSCHWCHVMERESFENDDIARFMNDHFICIKVDREERPDVDQIYMDAVQAMGINGGWPLNVFLTPDQKPFYGGTYFPPQSWLQLLQNVNHTFKNKREEINISAERLTKHISKSEVLKFDLTPAAESFTMEALAPSVNRLKEKFDTEFGGIRKAPKFPMPGLWTYLLRYAHFTGDRMLNDHVIFTLEKMARGGIYDQIGGGFSRYSVDAEWFAPHFEKMLYDNAQLVSLFSEAYLKSGNPIFREVIQNTVRFIRREMMSEEGGFYSALDADSEGEEGKYYTWSFREFEQVAGKYTEIWASFLGVEREGNWEPGKNILKRKEDPAFLQKKLGISEEKTSEKWKDLRGKLLQVREKRVRPGLDDKILAGWNALMIRGLVDAYHSTGDKDFLEMANKNAIYLRKKHFQKGILYRTSLLSNHPIPGYLEDYALLIRGLITLYQVEFNEEWLRWARKLIDHTLSAFYDENENLFYFTDPQSGKLITRKKELFDSVIPSSNSEMAFNLFLAGELFGNASYTGIAENMIRRMMTLLQHEPQYLANWSNLYLLLANPFAEIAILGPNSIRMKNDLAVRFIPNKIFCGSITSSDLPLLRGKKNSERTTIYVCYNKVCKLPVFSTEEALKLII